MGDGGEVQEFYRPYEVQRDERLICVAMCLYRVTEGAGRVDLERLESLTLDLAV